MKRINFQIIAALTVLSLFSCQKDMEPVQEPTTGKYDSADKVLQAVDALYRTGAPAFYGECSVSGVPAAAIGGYLSGFFETEAGAGSELYDNCRLLSFDAMAGYTKSVWDMAYNAIGMCNEAIDNIPLAPGLTEQQKNCFVAEARFFRAFNYFYLARSFGGVPLITQGASNSGVGKAELSAVYDLIVSDMLAAIPNLPDEGFAGNGYRIGRPAARTLLADVYLTMSGYPLQRNCYKQAADVARQVINGRKHGLVPNGGTPETSAYNRLRTQSDNAEGIYSYTAGAAADRSLAALCLSKEASQWGVLKTRTANAYMPSQTFLNVYDPYDDTRIQEQQFFHSFVKYEKNERTVIQTFPSLPYWWFDREALFGTGKSQRNVIIYRYAEVLLVAAEAIAMSDGATSEAAGYLADVRSRAYPKTDRETIVSQLTALSVDGFVAEIWAERLREFPLEMKIWTDIQRTRKYPAFGDKGSVIFSDVVGAANPLNVAFTEKHLLLPAP